LTMSSSTVLDATLSAPSSTSILFARGVIARLALWPALRVAVDNGWGGPESAAKRTWLASQLVDAFEEETTLPDAEYIATMLLQVMEDEYDTVLEDGSAETVARDIVALWDAPPSDMLAWEARAEGLRGKKVEVEVVEDGEGEWEDEEGESEESDGEDAPPLLNAGGLAKPAPVVDEDGFTLVQTKGKGRK
ncbi:hypothetical protein FA95DRAFT_1483061, partial [Auriscalpium vulgare]